jgi:Fic family protein
MNPHPPFTITPQILNTVERIGELLGAIGAGSLTVPPTLRRRNRVKSIVWSLAIEGNTLSEEQVTAILDGRPVFECFHPFPDGNGRLGRLWQTRLLAEWNPLFYALPLESVIHDHQQAYYEALSGADRASDSSGFVAFMLNTIEEVLRGHAKTAQEGRT